MSYRPSDGDVFDWAFVILAVALVAMLFASSWQWFAASGAVALGCLIVQHRDIR